MINTSFEIVEGAIYESKNFGLFLVTKFNSWRSVDIQFINTGTKSTVTASDIRTGAVGDRFMPKTYGVGFIGDGNHNTRTNPNLYARWSCMLKRCYSKKAKEYRFYGGKGVSVCDEWHNFQNFADWFVSQCEVMGEDPGKTKLQVDKDIKVKGNKIYSPETCALVTLEMNMKEAFCGVYEFMSPEGEVFRVYGLHDFCKKKNLQHGNMSQVHSGKRNHHKGWTKFTGDKK